MPEIERYQLLNDTNILKNFPKITFVLPYVQRDLQIEAPSVSLIKILGINSVSEYLEKLNSGDEVILHHYHQICKELELNTAIYTQTPSPLLKRVLA